MHPDALGKVSQVQFQPGTENRQAAVKFCSPCSSQSHERAVFQQTLNRERHRVYTVVWVKMRIELTSPKQKNSDRILKTAKQQFASCGSSPTVQSSEEKNRQKLHVTTSRHFPN